MTMRAGDVAIRACRWCWREFAFVALARGRRPQFCSEQCRREDHNHTTAMTEAAKRARAQRKALLRGLG